jgi:hypothetical protein
MTPAAEKGLPCSGARAWLDHARPISAPPGRHVGAQDNFDLEKSQAGGCMTQQQPKLAAFGTVLGAVPDGTILPSEGQLLAALTEAQRKAIETVHHEERLAALDGERDRQRR